MRGAHLGDVVAAARALRSVPELARAGLLARLFREADLAHRYGLQTGRNHRDHGDGSLMAAALRHPCVREPGLEDREYCRCLALVLLAVAARRDGET